MLDMGKIQVEILALLTTRLDELTMEIGMRRGGFRKHFEAQLDQNEAGRDIAHYMFLLTTRN